MSESVEERRRKEVIDKILTFPANTYTRAFLGEPHPKTGRKYSNSELESYLEQLQSTVSVEDQIVRAQAEIYAERTLHQLRMQQAQEPQRCAQAAQQLAKDKETFAALCRQHGLSACEANLNLWRSTNSISGLAVASPEEMEAYRQEAVEKRQDFLLNTDPTTLRSEVRRESGERRAAVVQDQAARELEAARQRDQYRGYRPLPPEIDSKVIKAASAVQLKQMMRLYGDFQITTRLRESA